MEYYTRNTDFFKGYDPDRMLDEFGSPLYVYNEDILRQRCREMTGFVPYENFKVTYSIKANANLELLKVIREEGLHADAMSPGEILVLRKAGFRPEEIFYISNNVSAEEMKYAVEKGIMVSVDSLSQLETYGKNFSGSKVSVRLNTGIGDGHHSKVVTGGSKTKFGINTGQAGEIQKIARTYHLRITGLNQHIGSLFMRGDNYIDSVQELLDVAKGFEGLEFVDFGGGFGIPYKKQEGERPLQLEAFGEKLNRKFEAFASEYGSRIMFRSEPGRYIVAECGILLGRVHARKTNGSIRFIGTDLGMNVLARPSLYNSHHDIEVYRDGRLLDGQEKEIVTVVGNICESGDILAHDRLLPLIREGDVLGVMDAGAYGYIMASNYNNRPRPAEVLIKSDKSIKLIRTRETIEDLLRNFL
ncbi:MAG: diaminopimelate decarboxylase [Clostridia bacterium]